MKRLVRKSIPLSLLLSYSIHANQSFVSFDFTDGIVDKGFADWVYSDVGDNPCTVYNGELQSKLCRLDGSKLFAYYNGYNTDHMGWMRYGYIDVDNQNSVSGKALKFVMTGGAYQETSGSIKQVGLLIKSKSQTNSIRVEETVDSAWPPSLPGDVAIYFKNKTHTTTFPQFKGKNRFSIWVLMPNRSEDIDTYTWKNKQRPEKQVSWYPFIDTASSGHYYHHASNISMGGWTKIQFDAHPTHHNGGMPNEVNAFNEGGSEYSGKGSEYFSNMAAFALRANFSANMPVDAEFSYDNFELGYVPYENEETINNVGVGYDPERHTFDISFEDKYRCLKCTAEYEVRYSFHPIDNANFQAAHLPQFITNFKRADSNEAGRIVKPNPGYNQIWAALDLQTRHLDKLTSGATIYFAIKDKSARSEFQQSSEDFELVEVPNVGAVRKVDLIKTIDYQIIDVRHPISIDKQSIKNGIVGVYYRSYISISGGKAPYRVTTDSQLPNGLTLRETGELNGFPLERFEGNLKLRIEDASGQTIYKEANLKIDELVDLNVAKCHLVVDFKESETQSIIEDSRFNRVFKDIYTMFTPLGTTKELGSNLNYDHQGVLGTGFKLFKGDRVRMTWKNIGNEPQELAPRVSFLRMGRFQYEEREDWLLVPEQKIDPQQVLVSELQLDADVSSTFININVNHSSHQTLVLDKVEFVEQARPETDICEYVQPKNQTFTVVDFNGSDAASLRGVPGLQKIIKDRYEGYMDTGLTTVAGDGLNYNYQGVTGSGTELFEGDVISITWKNLSSESLSFSPQISFDDPDRKVSGEFGNWKSLDEYSLGPGETKKSAYAVGASDAGFVSVINVTKNSSQSPSLVVDKIELHSNVDPYGFELQLLSPGQVGQNYQHKISTIGGVGQESIEVIGGLPTGLGLSSSGILEGIPALAGDYELLIKAYTSSGQLIMQSFELEILKQDYFDSDHCRDLVHFNSNNIDEIHISSEFEEAIWDTYTGFYKKGMTNVNSSNKDYNYQGVVGYLSPQQAGSIIRTVWYNDGDERVGFAPRISFTKNGRVSPSDSVDTWQEMEWLSIAPKSFAVAQMGIEHLEQGSELINVNVNYANNKTLMLNKIQLVDPSLPKEQICLLIPEQ